MSGFLLIKKDDSTKLEEIEDSFAESPDVFRKKGLTLAGKIVRKQFVLFS